MICIYKLTENWDILCAFIDIFGDLKVHRFFSWGSREGFFSPRLNIRQQRIPCLLQKSYYKCE